MEKKNQIQSSDLSTYQSINLSVCVSISIYLSIYLSIYNNICDICSFLATPETKYWTGN